MAHKNGTLFENVLHYDFHRRTSGTFRIDRVIFGAMKSIRYEPIKLLKWAFRENKILAKIHIVMSIEKQIMSALGNRFFSFVDRTSQTRDVEKLSF